ncbi:MAG: hypothetical protein OXI52_06700, partial [Caldilineaceae bacterium]|nr:hypothetical protein [Caldilineaceae bacterium]
MRGESPRTREAACGRPPKGKEREERETTLAPHFAWQTDKRVVVTKPGVTVHVSSAFAEGESDLGTFGHDLCVTDAAGEGPA